MVRHELDGFFARFGDAPHVDRGAAALGPAAFFSSANGAVARWAWQRVPFRDVAYAEDHFLAADMLRAGLAKAYVPEAAVVHSHDYAGLGRLRRVFDEFSALHDVHGLRRAALAALDRRARTQRRGCRARRAGPRGRARAGAGGGTLAALGYHAQRALGRSLGTNADQLPRPSRARLSLEARAADACGSRSSRSTTRAPPTRCSASGRTARRSPRATPAPTCGCSCCTGPCRRGPPCASADRPRCSVRCASRCAPSSTASRSPTCRSSRRRAGAPTARGARGRRRRWPLALRRLHRACRSTSSTPTTRRPPATRCAAAAPGARSSSPSTAATCSASRALARRRRGGRGARSRAAAARARQLRRRSPSAAARSGRARRRASCTSAPTCPARAPPTRRPTLVTVGHLVARKRHADVHARAAAAARRAPDLRYVDRRRRARARARSSGSPRAGRRRPRRVPRPAPARARRSRARAGARRCSCCRASTRRSASPTSRRWPAACPAIGCRGRARPGGDRRRRRRDAARAAGRPRGAGRRSCDALLAERRWRRELGRGRAGDRRGALHLGGVRPRDGRRLRGRAAVTRDPRPVLFVTNHAPPVPRRRVRARCTSARASSFALFGGALRHGGGGRRRRELPVPRHPPVRSASVARLAASRPLPRRRRRPVGPRRAARRRTRAPARRRVPFVLWATIWRHPRTPAHALSYLPLRHLYRHADASPPTARTSAPTCAPRAPARPVVEAPQSVDDAFWARAGARRGATAPFQALFAGPPGREKGVAVLLAAWRGRAGRRGADPGRRRPDPSPGRRRQACTRSDARPRRQLRNFYAGSDVVVVPSIPTRDFLEPWGLVVNEAFHQGVPVIATDAVGAAAGGLVQHERTGLVVPAGDVARSPERCAPARRSGAARAAWAPRRGRPCARTRTPRGPPE